MFYSHGSYLGGFYNGRKTLGFVVFLVGSKDLGICMADMGECSARLTSRPRTSSSLDEAETTQKKSKTKASWAHNKYFDDNSVMVDYFMTCSQFQC